ncbi:acyl-CoA dehydrogenase family protein [Parachlamydia acanthamoebae]|uniref:Putative acyl-CoA dehydrogenase FadE10 n=1 Tax=Parachlamydia acanthamoebae TaxID=83552 RepID=A0A0C1EC69_9BACT|nr:acyl-CoA dehydrogenase family protein [Parachlamydia acanthamoebae]KIA78672.1 putative acyl-CoA dehydrogenase FadE10 [Parachlamydia acanthamoebae]
MGTQLEPTKTTHDQAMEVAEEARTEGGKQPSFGAQLFTGNFDWRLLFPFPEQDPEDQKIGDAFADQLMALLTTQLDPDKVDETREIPKEVIAEMAKLGVFAMKIPKQYDGLGFSNTNYNRTVMKVASYCGSTAVLISAHQSIGVPQPLRLYGTEEQKKRFFPRFRKGSISAFALTEPEVGSDPARMVAEARLSEDGSHYILNGDKLWCTNGTIADIIIVIAKTAPKIVNGKEKQQISAFILEMNTPGVEVVHRCNFMGLGGIYNGLLRFKDVKIPVGDRLGEEGRGLAMALATINVGRLTLPAACTGAAKQCLYIAREWGTLRVQWGMPIALHEEGRQKVAYIASTTFAMEAVCWLTSNWADQGNVDIRIEAAMSKLFCTEALWKIADLTLQLRGGRGYEKASSLKARGELPYPVERVLRDCRINTILEGSTEIMKLFLAREAMDSHLQKLGFLLKGKIPVSQLFLQVPKLIGHYSWWYLKQLFKPWKTASYKELGALEKHYQFIEKTAPRLARTVFYYMGKYKKKLEHKQMLLGRLVEIGTDLFVMAATCSFAILKSEKEKQESAIDLADYFCVEAKRRIEENFAALTDNNDAQTNKIAKRVVERDYKWLEKGVVDLDTLFK